MFKKLLHRFTSSHNTVPVIATTIEGYIKPKTAKELLQLDRRQALLNHIWQHTSLSSESFQNIYLRPIERYAELVQEFPASENHHHAYLGGMLDHGLELIGHSLKIRQSYLMPPGAPPEDQAVQADAWTAAIAYGGLLHDIGKIAVDIQVQLQDGTVWHPWMGAINQAYRFKYIKGRDYQLHDAATGLLYNKIMATDILNWLSKYPELWGNLLNLLAGRYELAGMLGEIVKKADTISTAKNIGANPEKAMQAPVNSLQKKLITGLQHLIKHELHINRTPGDAWLTQDALWIMSKSTADKLRAYLLSQGFEGIPSANGPLFDELQSYGIIIANGDKAIWKATVTDNAQWKQDFTLLKIPPALIWKNGEERPEVFNGQIIVSNDTTTEAINSTFGNTEAALLGNTELTKDFNSEAVDLNGLTELAEPVAATHFDLSTGDDTDDILALFANEIPSQNTDTEEKADLLGKDHKSIIAKQPNKLSADESNPVTETMSAKTVKTEPEVSFLSTVTLNTKQEGGIPNKDAGQLFIDWLTLKIAEHKLPINDSNAKLHLVDEQLFIVTPGIFQRFCQENPELDRIKSSDIETWRWVQRGFEKVKMHKKRPDDLNIWECLVKGPRKKGKVIKGYLLEARVFFKEYQPNDNPFLTLQDPTAMD